MWRQHRRMPIPTKLLAIAAAGGALAIGVPAALAATDSPATGTRSVQQEAQPQERPDRDDCPEKGRGQGAATPDATATPDV